MNKIEGMENEAIKKIREVVNAETIIGEPIIAEGGVTIIPVSKVAYGFASGGSDLSAKNTEKKDLFGGGSGGGVSITPVAFLVISGSDVKLLQVQSFFSSIDRIVAMTPELMDKIKGMFKKKKSNKEEKE